jgi:membrane protease YdiL (CAAX protease family)
VFFIALGILKATFPEFEFERYQQTNLIQLMEENPWKFVIMAIIFAPLIEEGMFRTLIKPSQNELIFFISSWIFLGVISFIPADVYWAIKYGFLILFMILTFLFLKEFIPKKLQVNLCLFLGNYYKFIWILTSVIFGMVHIFNYVEGFQLNFLLILLIIPRIIAGFFFGKIKIKNQGLFWPITMHAMNNAIVLFVIFPKFL